MWRFLFLSCLLSSPVHGQSAAAAAKDAKGALQVRLLCVDTVPGADKLVVMEKSDEGWVPRWRLTVSPSFLSDGLGMQSKTLALGIDPAPPASNNGFNGPPVRVTAAMKVEPFIEFQVPASGTATAVLIADPAGASAKRPYRVVVLDSSVARFGAGSILVQNLSTAKIAGKLGGKAVRVGPGVAEVVVPDADQAGGMAQITLARAAGDELTVFCDTRWPAKAEYRRFLLLIPRQDGSIHPFVMPEYPPFR
jgi:hypothetical protein